MTSITAPRLLPRSRFRLVLAAIFLCTFGLLLFAMPHLAHAAQVLAGPAPAGGFDWGGTLALIAAVGVGLGAVLGGAAAILHAIAARSKNATVEAIAKDIDSVHDKLDQGLDLMRRVAPATSTPTPSIVKTPQAGFAVRRLLAVVGGLGMVVLVACATITADVKAFEAGAVACAKADTAQAKALGLQLGIDALAGVLAGQDAATVWAKVTADAEAGAKTQGVAVGACAFDGVIADLEKILHPTPPPDTATSALTASATVDPLAAGRAALAAFEARHGVTSVTR